MEKILTGAERSCVHGGNGVIVIKVISELTNNNTAPINCAASLLIYSRAAHFQHYDANFG